MTHHIGSVQELHSMVARNATNLDTGQYREMSRYLLATRYTKEQILKVKQEKFGNKKEQRKHSEEARAILLDWFESHSHHPYPTNSEKEQLMWETGLTRQQILDWFVNQRKRHWIRNPAPCTCGPESDMLRVPFVEAMASSEPRMSGEEDKFTFEQVTFSSSDEESEHALNSFQEMDVVSDEDCLISSSEAMDAEPIYFEVIAHFQTSDEALAALVDPLEYSLDDHCSGAFISRIQQIESTCACTTEPPAWDTFQGAFLSDI